MYSPVNRSFTSNSKGSGFLAWRYLYKKKWTVVWTGVVVALICEIYFRVPFLPQQLEYQPDLELGAVLRPNQRGYMWLGNMSFKSALISINRDGHRGTDTNWSEPVLLAAGNSEAFGTGVRDDEIWTARLQDYMRQENAGDRTQVINIAHPGHGPFQQQVRMERALALAGDVRGIVIRVDVADRYFRPISKGNLEEAVKAASMREEVRRCTKSLPYFFNKIQAQIPTIKRGLTPGMFRGGRSSSSEASVGSQMWDVNQESWEGMLALSEGRGYPVVFMIYDRGDTQAAKILYEELKSVCGQKDNVRVFRLGPDEFHSELDGPGAADGDGGSSLTLGRDPHASPLQHELIARAVFAFLRDGVQRSEM